MSLAVLADHMASKGRGPDSMLIHMSPREVQGLQALAMRHGGSLTINPDTGLPEAGFLDKLLPAIVGFAITATTGIPAWQVGLGIGAEEAIRTGDLGKGLSRGLQAYSGGTLGGNITDAGASTLGAEEVGKGLTMTPELSSELLNAGAGESAAAANNALQQQVAERMANASPYEKMVAGFDSAKANPMATLKANAMPLAGATAPAILAEMGVKQNMPKTTTKPGMITPYSYFGGQYVAGNPYEAVPTKAAEGGLMGMAAGGYSPGMLDFAQHSEPVLRMAEGGIAGYADGGYTQEQINAALQAELAARPGTSLADLTNYAKSQYKLSDAQINSAYDTIPGFNAQGKWDKADYLANDKLGTDYQIQVDAANAANPFSAQNMANVDVTRPGHYVTDPTTGKPVALTSYSPGFDINNPTALTYLGELTAKGAQSDAANYFNQNATADQKAKAASLWAAEKARLDALDAAKAPTGLAGLNQNQNLLTNQGQKLPTSQDQNAGLAALANLPAGASEVDKWFTQRGLGLTPIDTSINKFLATYKNELAAMTPKQQEDAMRAALNVEKMNEADVIRATGKTIAQLAAAKRADGSLVVAGPLDEVPIGSLPGGVSGAGNTVVNANGTITTRPDIPGIPEGGFTGMTDVRDAYTKGGGSLGYVPYAPKTIEEFNAKYVNPLKGGTKQAYDYLTGKEEYNPIPYTKDGQIAKSYAESVMKMPVASSSKMYIFKDGKFIPNPDYAIPTYDKDGKKSSNLTNADVKSFMDKNPSTDAFYTWATTNNLSPEQIAMASGRPINEISKLFTGAKELTGEDGKIDQTKVDAATAKDIETNWDEAAYLAAHPDVANELKTGKSVTGQPVQFTSGYEHWLKYGKASGVQPITKKAANGGLMAMARGGQFDLGDYSDGGRLLRGPGDGVSDSIPASIGNKRPARLADGEFVVPARIVSELGNGSTEAGARKLYAMMDRIQAARRGTVGKGRVAKNSRADKHLPA